MASPDSPDRNRFAEEYAPEPSRPLARPTGLTAISIILIVLGVAGLMTVVFGGLGLVFNTQVQSWTVQPPAGKSNRMLEAQAEMQRAMNDINRENQTYYAIALVAHLIVAILLVIAGTQLLRMRPSAEMLIQVGCVMAIMFEVARQALSILIQLQTMRVLQEHLGDMAGGPGPAGDVLTKVVPWLMYAGLALGAFWTLVKITFYAFSIAYVRKPSTRALLVDRQTGHSY